MKINKIQLAKKHYDKASKIYHQFAYHIEDGFFNHNKLEKCLNLVEKTEDKDFKLRLKK
jgi:predicted RNA-binding protein associated with RNAse of E/G family